MNNNFYNFIKQIKLGLLIGFLVGTFLFPLLTTLGLVIQFFEIIRPLLLGPFDFIAQFIPDDQVGPNTFHVPVYKWIVTLGFNGLFFSAVGGIIQYLINYLKKVK